MYHFNLQYGLSSELVGILFLVMAAFYSVASPVWGWLADRIVSLHHINICVQKVTQIIILHKNKSSVGIMVKYNNFRVVLLLALFFIYTIVVSSRLSQYNINILKDVTILI